MKQDGVARPEESAKLRPQRVRLLGVLAEKIKVSGFHEYSLVFRLIISQPAWRGEPSRQVGWGSARVATPLYLW